jgi:hypothetical protein
VPAAESRSGWPGQHPGQRDAVVLDHQRPFHAHFAAVDRGRPGALTPAGGLGDAPVDGDLVQQQTDDAVVGGQRDLFELGEQSGFDPFVATVADRGGRAGGIGDRLIATAEPQHLDELVEHDPIADPRGR